MKTRVSIIVLTAALAACSGQKSGANNQSSAPNQTAPASTNAASPANGQAANAQAPTGGAVTAQEVRAMIQRDGAAATVRTLNQGSENGPTRYNAVEEGISRGDQAWLDLVPLLRPATDGETATGMMISLSEALPKNPAGVLRLISADLTAQDVCTDERVEPSPEQAKAYRQAAIPAVEGVTDPALQQAKTACLASLRG